MGLLLENLAAASLHTLALHEGTPLHHWRESRDEVDLIHEHPTEPLAFEIGSSARHSTKGLVALQQRHARFAGRCYLVAPDAPTRRPAESGDGVGSLPLDQFLVAVGRQAERALNLTLTGAPTRAIGAHVTGGDQLHTEQRARVLIYEEWSIQPEGGRRSHNRGSPVSRRVYGTVSQQVDPCSFAIRVVEQPTARDEHVGASRGGAANRHIGDPAVDLELDRQPDPVYQDAGLPDLRLHRRDIALSSESGIDGHDQHEVGLGQHVFDRLDWRMWIESYTGPGSKFTNAA